MSISTILQQWFSTSPAHGVRRIGQAKSLFARLFWSYNSWIFTILMCCFIHTVIMQYSAHPTKIQLTLRPYRYPEHFPAITFCKKQQHIVTHFQSRKNLILGNVNPLKDDGFVSDDRKPGLPGYENSSKIGEQEYRKIVAAYMERILAAQVSGERHPLVKSGFQLDDLLITCIFNKHLCYRNLTQIFHPNYGNCYTFDHYQHVQNEEINDIRYDWSMNDDNGDKKYNLYLEIYLHQKDYIEYLDQRAALRLFVHRKQEIPMLSETSLLLRPNKYTELSFLPRVMSFSRRCRNDSTAEMKRFFRTQQARYTQPLCFKLCEHRFIIARCQCIEQTFAVFYQFFSDQSSRSNITLCSINDPCLVSRGYFSKLNDSNS